MDKERWNKIRECHIEMLYLLSKIQDKNPWVRPVGGEFNFLVYPDFRRMSDDADVKIRIDTAAFNLGARKRRFFAVLQALVESEYMDDPVFRSVTVTTGLPPAKPGCFVDFRRRDGAPPVKLGLDVPGYISFTGHNYTFPRRGADCAVESETKGERLSEKLISLYGSLRLHRESKFVRRPRFRDVYDIHWYRRDGVQPDFGVLFKQEFYRRVEECPGAPIAAKHVDNCASDLLKLEDEFMADVMPRLLEPPADKVLRAIFTGAVEWAREQWGHYIVGRSNMLREFKDLSAEERKSRIRRLSGGRVRRRAEPGPSDEYYFGAGGR